MTHRGLYTALVTPFRNNKVDVDAYKQLIERQIAAGVDGIVPVGTTGESPTLTHEEHLDVIRYAVETAAGRCQVIAGTGSNSTREAINMTQEAERAGADGTLQVAPYYNRPSQEGIYLHFKAIAEQTALPIMLYSIPGRCGVEIAVETAAALAKDCGNIISIKEAGGSVDRVNQLLQALPESCSILSGDDGLAVPFISCGARGLVSVTSNLAPAAMKELVDAALSGDGKLALELQKKYYPLMKGLMSLDTNPVPIKAALAACGLMTDEIHLPLVPLAETKIPALKELLTRFGLL
ncbi:4-hydroxy-tetrahydrodipicolinate synthase [Akkermansia glycaniphila]|uniref:4-hydroxy-tetrahydrodipicolinate synthase n=1 Tax=Akkermansia glycaniphila TaxID=1679444 RepID=A0A1C7PEZ0_9BACT|nr:4-hydroxy-tetrahydrodipicolinate synthase [Akkermansia glycaniphila]OCA03929.1 dihydrodipicolinate synthase [Akkermansia glycaniphila]SEH70739.1 aldolase-type tim barrel [Akkermansia glycaniphila]